MLDWQKAGRHERRMQEVQNLVFQNHPQFLEFLFEREDARLREAPEQLLAEARAFSTGEQILIRVGLDLWCGLGNVHLWDIVERLDEDNYHQVLLGLRHLRPNENDGGPMVWRQPKRAYSESGVVPIVPT